MSRDCSAQDRPAVNCSQNVNVLQDNCQRTPCGQGKPRAVDQHHEQDVAAWGVWAYPPRPGRHDFAVVQPSGSRLPGGTADVPPAGVELPRSGDELVEEQLGGGPSIRKVRKSPPPLTLVVRASGRPTQAVSTSCWTRRSSSAVSGVTGDDGEVADPRAMSSAGKGSKGDRIYDWLLIDPGADEHLLLVRRSISKPDELAYCICQSSTSVPVAELVRVAGSRWGVEETFQFGKNETGLDHYQVRHYDAWYRHITQRRARRKSRRTAWCPS